MTALQSVIGHQQSAILLEAPTGFGKTGVLLEAALTHLRAGHFERVLYLTGKATGQLQVVRTLQAMTSRSVECNQLDYNEQQAVCHLLDDNPIAPGERNPELETRNSELEIPPATPVAVWVVRPKSEHCVNTTFHCVRATCAYLADMAARWPRSGLARFYLNENEPRDLDSLRAAGREALICPYEITRTALGFNDVWIGDYNYVFAPANRGLFFEQPGFDPARSLLIVDEAHNLPTRVADAYSHRFSAPEADTVRAALYRTRSHTQLVEAWDHWTHFLHQLTHRDALALADEDDARHLLEQVARLVASVPLDYATLGPEASERLWQVPALVDQLENNAALTRHWWCPRAGELTVTCLDAAPAIGAALREFGGVVLASATFGPESEYAESLGLDDPPAPEPPPAEQPGRLGKLTKRDTRRLFKQLTSGAELLKVEEARAAAVTCLRAGTPWRDDAYDVAYDLRVDTTFQHRARHYATTAATIAAMHRAAARTDAPSPAPSSSDPAEDCRAASPYRAPEVRHPHAAVPRRMAGSGDPALQHNPRSLTLRLSASLRRLLHLFLRHRRLLSQLRLCRGDPARISRRKARRCAWHCNNGSRTSPRRRRGWRPRWRKPTRSFSCSARVSPRASTSSAVA